MDKLNGLIKRSVHGSTERRILSAARQEFIEHGLKGTRMQSIADRAQVNKALLHYYFRSKERLYREVFRNIMQTMKAALEAQLSGVVLKGDVQSMLRSFITVYITTLRDNPDFPRFILREIVEGGNNMPKVIKQLAPLASDIPTRVTIILKREMDAGAIKRIAPLHLMLNVLGMCIFTFIARPIMLEISKQLRLGVAFDNAFFDNRIEAVLDMALNGILIKKRGK